ncbi:MAG: SDR family oxidoreductase [Gammaproteobacteria bacterium]|nr:SDR family oxidoreductase [Gammaproteobacteria bacterium]
MKTVMVTGANRGIGLEFCRQFASEGDQVFACCRDPESAKALQKLAGELPGIVIMPLDVSSAESITEFQAGLNGQVIDLLINNAGVYGDNHSAGFGGLDYQLWQQVFAVNTLAPVRLAEALLPNLLQGQKKLIVALTSKMGSIADNGSGGALLYRSSKAALNAAMRSLAIDFSKNKIGILILHPGWVKTDMGGPHALISSAQSVSGMKAIIDGFKSSQSGSFLDYTGEVIPW